MVERVTPGVVQIITPDSTGTGFVVTPDGRIVTNEHVVGAHVRVTVRIPGVGNYDGHVLGVDAVADLAIVDIDDGIAFTVLNMGDSDRLSLGEDVVAIGFPLGDMLGQNPTITRGVASSVRELDGVEHIQTDAAINPGNSGGPLFNGAGEVIGVNTSTIEKVNDRIIDGVSFAVSINEVKNRLGDLSSGQSVARITPTNEAETGPGYFYLESGELPHDDDEYIETMTAFEAVRNFDINAYFEVPYSSSAGDWSVGFIFRDSGNNWSDITVTQDGQYSHNTRIDGESTKLISGYASEWNQNVGDENALGLVVVESRGWLFINSLYVADLNLSGTSELGGLEVATGLLMDNEVPGKTTRLREVLALEIEKIHGPSSGSLISASTSIATRNADVDSEFAYAAAEFRIPENLENWSAGLLFRKRDREDYLLFSVSSATYWAVEHATVSGENWQTLEEGFAGQVDLDSPILNRLEVFYVGEVAIVYANGRQLGVVNIGVDAVPESGDVRAAYGIHRNNDDSTAQYENFVVYGLPDN